MKTIYRAENVIDSSLIKDLLDQAGIMAFVNGQHLQGGVGELPVTGFVTVTVADPDEEAARTIVDKFEHDTRQQTGQGDTRWDHLNDGLLDWKS